MTAIRLKNAPDIFLENFWWNNEVFDFSKLEKFFRNFWEKNEIILKKNIKNKEKKIEKISQINRLKWMNIQEIEKNFYNLKTETYWPFQWDENSSFFNAIINEKIESWK